MKKSNRNIILLNLYLKQALLKIPKLIILCIALAAVLGAITFITAKLTHTETGIASKIAFVSDSDSHLVSMAKQYIEEQINCEFIDMDYDSAVTQLQAGKLTAILYFPNDFKNTLLSGNGEGLKLIYDKPGHITGSSIFQHMARSGMADIAALDSAEKLVKQVEYEELNFENDNKFKEFENEALLMLVARHRSFDRTVYSDTGTLSIKGFYIGSFLIELMMFSGMFLQDILSRKTDTFLASINRVGISNFQSSLFQYFSVVLLYIPTICAAYTLCGIRGVVHLSLLGYISAIVLVLCTVSMLLLIYQLCDSGSVGTIVVFGSTLLMVFWNGSIIPISMLPSAAYYISPFLPTKYITELSGGIVENTIAPRSIIICMVITAICLLLTLLTCKLRKMK